ncbi:nuclear transport factor 2 family protein [Streptomyces sp. NPDC060022]|uniref:nuclear transport factor 2 family protein n=1 Tax=Streptomyces sp. NPDC060022 TaxID=3347039 RepID=UPI00367C1E33
MTAGIDRRSVLGGGAAAAAAGTVLATAPTALAAETAGRITSAEAERWTAAYLRAWRTKDADGAGRLFSEDALYEAVPGVVAQTFRGRDAIKEYWREVTAPQSDLTALQGTPLITGDRACVELWVTLRANGANPTGGDSITLIETNIPYFGADRLCHRNAEYWNLQPGRLDPPHGWGSARH